MSPVGFGSNIVSLKAQRQLSDATTSISNTFQRLSSGFRINRASDDAAGLAVSTILSSKARVFTQGIRNFNDGLSFLSIADGAIEELTNVTTRLIELAQQAANGSYSSAQRKALDTEAQALSEEFFRISRATEFNGIGMFDGTTSEVRLQGGFGESGGIVSGLGGNLGTGAFSLVNTNTVGMDPTDLTTGDFNGDGHLDIMSADLNAHSVGVQLGRGDGTFTTRVSYATQNNPWGVATADVNGDGILDAISANFSSASASVLIGRGDGSFNTSVSYTVGTNPEAIVTGDFNGDGNIDFASADSQSDSLSVLLGRGNGTFAPRVAYTVGDEPGSVQAGDFNGDGALDLISGDQSGSTASVLLGRGDGTFQTVVTYTVGGTPYDIQSADFNGDGNLDIVTADFVGDSVSILMGRGDGTFAARVSYSAGDGPSSIATADFNGDGITDIAATGFFTHATNILLGRGDGTFNPRVSYSVGVELRSIAVGDFNEDGVQDIVAADTGTETVHYLRGTTREGISPLLPFSLNTQADALQALPILNRKREQLTTQRGVIGAFESRVSTAISTLGAIRETFKAASSRITDADVAKESADLLRTQILQRAASAVLAQANQQPALAITLLSANG